MNCRMLAINWQAYPKQNFSDKYPEKQTSLGKTTSRLPYGTNRSEYYLEREVESPIKRVFWI